jgi:hypothetical protein
LAGYSLGGLFSVYSLVQRPDLFAGRLALSPSLWRGDQAVISELRHFFESSSDLESFLYVSLGSQESGSMQDGFAALVDVLEAHAPPGLRWQSQIVQGADHENNSWRSTPSALRGFWEHWRQTQPTSSVEGG